MPFSVDTFFQDPMGQLDGFRIQDLKEMAQYFGIQFPKAGNKDEKKRKLIDELLKRLVELHPPAAAVTDAQIVDAVAGAAGHADAQIVDAVAGAAGHADAQIVDAVAGAAGHADAQIVDAVAGAVGHADAQIVDAVVGAAAVSESLRLIHDITKEETRQKELEVVILCRRFELLQLEKSSPPPSPPTPAADAQC